VEEDRLQNELVCECELVTRRMLEHAARSNPTVTLDDLRRDVRLGMGPCQGGFCTYRAVGIIHEMQENARPQDAAGTPTGDGWDVAYMQSPGHIANQQASRTGRPALPPTPAMAPNLLLRDFVQERWKGLTPILWGQQLKQERLDELIYLSLMNADHLPADDAVSPLTDFYLVDTTPGAGATPQEEEHA
jgi:glycerol-3-phosphate dehydrogenase